MLESPKNYEEAKVIIKNSVGDNYQKHFMRKAALRTAFVSLASFGAAVAVGLISKNQTAALYMLPGSALISLTTLVPFILQHRTNKRIESGKYFENKTEQEIMNIARTYVSDYNNYERSKTR